MQKICLILPSSVSPTVTAERKIDRIVKAIDDLLVEYAMLFLTYIFQPTTIQGYCDIILLQVRAKSVLESILVSRWEGRLKRELKVLYAMRSKLSWSIFFKMLYFISCES